MKELIEQKAMLLTACKLTKKQIETELYELIGSINSAQFENSNVSDNEIKETDCKCISRQPYLLPVDECIECGTLFRFSN